MLSTSLEVKYRMHDKFYPEVDEMGHHNIDEDEIAKSLLPYIISFMKSIEEYMRTTNSNKSFVAALIYIVSKQGNNKIPQITISKVTGKSQIVY